jgi:hypothetical protein
MANIYAEKLGIFKSDSRNVYCMKAASCQSKGGGGVGGGNIERCGIRPDKCQRYVLKACKPPVFMQYLFWEARGHISKYSCLMLLSFSAISERVLDLVIRHLTAIRAVRLLWVSVLVQCEAFLRSLFNHVASQRVYVQRSAGRVDSESTEVRIRRPSCVLLRRSYTLQLVYKPVYKSMYSFDVHT